MAVTQAGAQLERCHQVPLDREIAVQICLADALFIERRECRDGLRVFDANPEFDGALADTLRLTCVVELESGFGWKRSRERVQDTLHLAGRGFGRGWSDGVSKFHRLHLSLLLSSGDGAHVRRITDSPGQF